MIQVPVSLLGHRDHGKSTLIGRLLMDTESVPKERVAHAQVLSNELSDRFEYAFLLDSFREERTQGMTMDTTSAKLKYEKTAFELIDVPGHKTLVKNMLSGASRAFYALLVVSAKNGEGFQEETRLHLALAKMLGLQKIVACVTKMDLVRYDRGVFERLQKDVNAFLEFAGFDLSQVFWIPVSAMDGANLSFKSDKTPWYADQPLLQTMQAVFGDFPDLSKASLRFLVQDRYDSGGRLLYVGSVKQGTLRVGDSLTFLPQDVKGRLEALGSGNLSCVSGQNDGLEVAFVGDKRPARGSIAILNGEDMHASLRFSATLFVLPGFRLDFKAPLEFQNSSATVSGRFLPDALLDIHAACESQAAQIAEEMSFLRGTFQLDAPVVAEPFDVTAFLGRFVIRQKRAIAGVGVVHEVFS